MAHLKGEYVLNQVEVIEEEPEEDEDEGELEQKVRRDLMMHVEDPSDFYISPPSNTPIKAVSSPSDPRKEAEGGFMLKDIMDL